MRAGVLQPRNREVLPMKQTEDQIDYHNEPLLILPLAVHSLDCIYLDPGYLRRASAGLRRSTLVYQAQLRGTDQL